MLFDIAHWNSSCCKCMVNPQESVVIIRQMLIVKFPAATFPNNFQHLSLILCLWIFRLDVVIGNKVVKFCVLLGFFYTFPSLFTQNTRNEVVYS